MQRTATTRSLTARVVPTIKLSPAKNPDLRLTTGSFVRSALTRRSYCVGEMLGSGGFGAVYRITGVSGGSRIAGACVLKVTIDVGAWHREAYFGELLREALGVVQVHESFAWVAPGQDAHPLYCLVSEHVEGGDLIHYLEKRPEPWPEVKARREIARLLGSLRLLHASGLVHRDITPRNVFVTRNGELKLGDFGIAAQRLGGREASADVFAPWFAPTAIRKRKSSSGVWLPADDVYHLGKLFALLLHGGEKSKLTAAQVKTLDCSAAAKAIIERSIGEWRKRFVSAEEMLTALKARVPEASGRAVVRSLNGKHVVFTGRFTIARKKAMLLLKRAGGIMQIGVNQFTDVLVVGEQSPHWKAEKKGQKLLDLDRERERGHRVAVIGEKRFQKLVKGG